MVDKNRRREIVRLEKLKLPERWVEIHFKSKAVVSTKGKPPGLWLEEDPGFTMLDTTDDGAMVGFVDYESAENSPRLTAGTMEEFIAAQKADAGRKKSAAGRPARRGYRRS